jgi:hypothetical protein
LSRGTSRRAVRTAAWYRKKPSPFADTLAAVRREIRQAQDFSISRTIPDVRKLPRRLQDGTACALMRRSVISVEWPKSNQNFYP